MDGTSPNALRRLPAVDVLLRSDAFDGLPRAALLREARTFLDELRDRVLRGELGEAEVGAMFDSGGAHAELRARCELAGRRRHRRIVNATGIVLHTGVGRAPLAPPARDAVADAAGYAVVEVDPLTGERNQREEQVGALLAELCGVEGALVVNNNAAMVVLVLRSLAAGHEVVVSRGELVEIGGGFRMPDVMAEAGCRMVEVGATNKTHLRDFSRAITPATAMLLKVHPSNFRVVGFAATPTLDELAGLARDRGVLLFEDLGSGLLVRDPVPGLEHEPSVHASVASGAPLISFSGDKLLGGPQCGILVGDRELVARVRAHPLYRAFRCDKLTLAGLEATLRIYRDGDPLREVPTLRLLSWPRAELRTAAQELCARLAAVGARVVETESYAGSGANPARPIPSYAVAVDGGEELAATLRARDVAVFTRIADGAVLLDLRTLMLEDRAEVARAVLASAAG